MQLNLVEDYRLQVGLAYVVVLWFWDYIATS